MKKCQEHSRTFKNIQEHSVQIQEHSRVLKWNSRTFKTFGSLYEPCTQRLSDDRRSASFLDRNRKYVLDYMKRHPCLHIIPHVCSFLVMTLTPVFPRISCSGLVSHLYLSHNYISALPGVDFNGIALLQFFCGLPRLVKQESVWLTNILLKLRANF